MSGEFAGKEKGSPGLVSILVAFGVTLPAPAMAQTIEDEFLQVAPLPAGIENVTPLPDAANVRFQDCEAFWPDGYRAWRAESVATEDHARKRDIYSWLRARLAFEAKDCGCAGKVAPWEDVDRVYEALKQAHGRVEIKHTAAFAAQADVLTGAVERMCGGSF
ncbi:hypothetical protein IQ03_04901 [Gemmobacter caeni]|uniref:Uncharacterized protein n=1 Tax=Gemmobacter caeni TaxID=589035 RepID=A0A2T6ADB5_9RHOB|nr:hypothetical protein [Gemmobacter caeni]PTX41814.1 hypothetical protein C8N34_12719 [Gemmobacter caeni]TWI90623.1 hypothetical protein IQ03_04901 [Gemmobacter caeni]